MADTVGRLDRLRGLSLPGRRPQRHRKDQDRTGDTHVNSQLIGNRISG
jgi:hypothetical protein